MIGTLSPNRQGAYLNKMKKIIVTTSWDDGHVLDIRLARLLKKYNLKGTFYISPKEREIARIDRLSDLQIRALSADMEIGAHTMTHPILTKVGDDIAKKEIGDSKSYLEKISGKTIVSFCYPAGCYNKKHKTMLKKAGFKLGRTVKRFGTDIDGDFFAIPTTIQAYRHWSDILPIFRNAGMGGFIRQYLNWDELAISIFDKMLENGGIFHLWGHSWEIDKNNDWQRLERVLKHISDNTKVKYLTNGELI
jgi:peptidoglycan/xylan/chitin deacetylase (PgdA/CDA1 family)